MSILQDVGHGFANLFPVSGLVASGILEGRSLLADPNFDQIFQSTVEIFSTSDFCKQTAVVLKFNFRCRY